MAFDEIDTYLLQWEETYKKGLLSFWMLLQLANRETYPYEMRGEIAALSGHMMVVDDNSIYRALRRFAAAGLVESHQRESVSGPPRRYFRLSPKGQELLARFIRRNILTFQRPEVTKIVKQVLDQEA